VSFNTVAIVEVSNGTGVAESEASSGGRDGLQFMQLGIYGFISRPPVESLTVLMPLNGDPSNCVGITDDPDHGQMPDLAEGECAFGVYASGSYIHFKADGTIFIKGRIVHEGDTVQTGTHTASVDVIAAGVSLKTHKHPYTDDGVPLVTGVPNAGS
jgi:phage gp45-like